ncbi:hypothetical protein BE08_04350 [Sorangium cellulosum]|uniref:Uncharacterized protein n=1 Tax=Sorangium cellulosum TaxID=56 RepID=A0A150PPW4_SORCE|nr:hypothetical protein BE08_04350 [Sorangium cellulosum]
MLALAGCGDRGKAAARDDAKRPPAVLQFEGHVYAPMGTSDFKLLERVRAQTRSVFTGLRRSRVMVSRREVQGATTDLFVKEAVTVVDTATGKRDVALRVRYRYVARPEIANGIDGRTELDLALLHREDDAIAERVLEECTAKPEASKRGASSVGLDFDPSLPSCKAAIAAEQAAIDAARAKLPELAGGSPGSDVDTVVTVEEARRVYIPARVTVELRDRKPGEVAPRYVPVDGPEEIAEAPEAGPSDAELPEGIEPAAVIIDPDLPVRTPEEQALAAEGALLPKLPGSGGTSTGKRLPQVVSPAVAEAQQRKVEAHNDRFEIPFETLADPKFLVVWLSLLMAYPILRGDPRKRG